MSIQSQSIETFLSDLEQSLPVICRSKDLVGMELFSTTLLSKMRKDGNGPPFFKIARGQIRYLKSDVISWLKSTRKVKDLESK
jgi:hypothetical protein